MLNLKRMSKRGILCPDVLYYDQHILVLSLIGANGKAAPKVKDSVPFLTPPQKEVIFLFILLFFQTFFNFLLLLLSTGSLPPMY